MSVNIGQMLVNTARRLPDRPALSWGPRTLSYAELASRADPRPRRGLSSLGVVQGDRVGLLMRNRPELVETMYACFLSGVGLVPMNARLTGAEVAYHVADAGAAVVVTDEEGAAELAGADIGPATVVATGAPAAPFVAYEELLEGAGQPPLAPAADVTRDDLAWLFYTSGTTGRPKGAMLGHANLGFVVASWLADLTPMDENDVVLHAAAPQPRRAGFHALAATARGAHQVMLGRRPVRIPGRHPRMPDGRTARVTNTWMVPTQIVMLAGTGPRRPRLGRPSPEPPATSSTAALRCAPADLASGRGGSSGPCSCSCSGRARRR